MLHLFTNIKIEHFQAIFKVCPGLLTETHILSPEELRLYSDDPYCYSPQMVTSAIMEAESTLDVIMYNPNTNSHETISQMIMFGTYGFPCIIYETSKIYKNLYFQTISI